MIGQTITHSTIFWIPEYDSRYQCMNGLMKKGCTILVVLLLLILITTVTAYTTEVTVQRIAVDGITPINETTVSHQWMETHLPVYGDGKTLYYSQGPTFNESDYWDNAEWQNVESRNWSAVIGTDLKDLCNLVGGGSPGSTILVAGDDMVGRDFSYESVYTPNPRQGPMVVTWKKDGMYPESGYDEGMRLIMFADAKVNTFGWNTSGWHVFGNADMRDCWPSQYWYNYSGIWPSAGGTSVRIVRYIKVYTSDPIPHPVADFSANIKTGQIVNGNFETGALTPWSGSGATIYTGASADYKHGTASVKLAAPQSSAAWISQSIDLTGLSTVNFYRDMFGGTGKYLQVYIDSTLVANYTETATVIATQSIDISSYGFTGTHTIRFNAVNSLTSGTFTVYLDDIEDYGPGTSGRAPLTIQFKDLSTKMDDSAHTSWIWDFYNNGTATSTQQNPQFVYMSNGTFTVKLTVTNAGGSDSETKTSYITVGTVAQTPVANFTAAPRSGTAPLTVQFNDSSTNTPVSWKWAYKNATSVWTQFSTVRNASFTFPAGTYDINLTATNAAGSDDELKTGYITATAMPYIDVSIIGSIDNWNFQTGTNEDTTSVDLEIDTNMNQWSVGVKDALDNSKPAGSTGKMAEWSGSAYVVSGKILSNAVQVKSGTGNYILLSGTNQQIQAGNSPGLVSYHIGMEQLILPADPALSGNNRYRVVVTFTGGAA